MSRLASLAFAALILASAVVPASAADPVLKVPEGFAISKVTTSAQVKFPMLGDFDDKGRLYVIDIAGPLDGAEVMKKAGKHRIVRLEDTTGNGSFDRATVFADNLPFPEGVMCKGGSVYVACPPQILKLSDTDGDGKADRREVWFDGKTLTGCANDMHGPYAGPDGMIYWTKGAFAAQDHVLGNGRKFHTRAAHLFRAKVDGSGLEVMMTGGMDNPVGVAFTPDGEPILSNTFLQHPGDGKRDGLIHAVPGGIWGKDHDPIYEHPWTSPETMPVMTHMGPAAPSGIRAYRSTRFGKDYVDNLFCAQFNLRKVSRHVLQPVGSTWKTADSDFVTSDDPDFHPTDVIEAPDGSLLVIDTGGWYKLCCPSSQLVKADVWGAIYRVTKVGTAAVKTAPRPLAAPPTALHARRQEATKMGRAGDPEAVPQLLTWLADANNDRFLDHALTFALIEIAAFDATAEGLRSASPQVKRATLAALEAIDPKRLKSADVVPLLAAGDVSLRETAWWVAGKHPEWGGELVGYFREKLSQKLGDAEREELTARLAKFARNEPIQRLIADSVDNPIAVRAMARAGLKIVPPVWIEAASLRLGRKDAEETVGAVRSWNLKSTPKPLAEALDALAAPDRSPSDIRLAALAAAPRGELPPERFGFVMNILYDGEPAERVLAADVVTRVPLSAGHLKRLAEFLPRLGIAELPKLLPKFEQSKDEEVGLALVGALKSPALAGKFRIEQVEPILSKYPEGVRKAAIPVYEAMNAELAGQRQKLADLIAALPAGDSNRGRIVFQNAKALCASCHKIGYVGGVTGPDLSRIGSIRTERDLLEAIVYPSASFVRSYEPWVVVTKAGRTLSGILKKDAPDEVILTIAADKEERIARGDIDEIRQGTVSLMPAGLDQNLSKQDLADLVAYLKICR